MKKFLTVLLVVSVMFTFSFSSAFATVSVDEQIVAKVAEEQAEMAKEVYKYAAKFVYNQAGYLVSSPDGTITDANLTKVAVEAGIEAVIATYNDVIEAVGLAQQAAGVYDEAALDASWTGAAADAAVKAEAKAIYTKAVADAKASLDEVIDGIDVSAYTTADKAAVKAEIAAAEAVMEAAENTESGLAAIVAAEEALENVVEAKKPVAKLEEELAKAKAEALEDIAEMADKFVETKTEALEAIIDSTTSTPAQVIAAQAELAALAGNVDAVVGLYEGRIDDIVVDAEGTYKTYDAAKAAVAQELSNATYRLGAGFDEIVEMMAGTDLLVAYAETLANGLKNAYSTTTGLATYNASTVDAKLAEVVAKIENLQIKSYDAVAAAMVVPTAEAEAAALKAEIEAGVKAITTGKYDAKLWADENKEAVKDIQEDYEAQIKAATSAKEIEALVEAAQDAMDAYLTTAQEAKLIADYAYVLNGYKAALTQYAAGVVAKDVNGEYTAKAQTEIVEQAMEVLEDAIVAAQDADLTKKEVEAICDANYAAALAVVEGIMTKDALAAEKKAVEAAIDALPTVPTLEAKAEYLAVKDMVEAYEDLAGADDIAAAKETKLNGYLTKLARLDKEAVVAVVKALPAAKAVTVADKDAILEAIAANEAFEDEYETTIGSTYTKKLADVEDALENALMLDAAKKIAALPADIAAADKAAVEAAAAAYANLTEDAQKVFDVASKALVEKLAAAEKALKVELAYTVESLKITARSEAKKGSITVKWTVDGDDTGVEAYEIWKSTKKNSGFKKAFTTAKTSYKNTKGLKKGTKYFYKVRAIAYDAEGAKIKSDWSNKAYRTAK